MSNNLATDDRNLPRPEIATPAHTNTALDIGSRLYICEQTNPVLADSELLTLAPHLGVYIFPQDFDVSNLDKYTLNKKELRRFDFNKLSVDALNRRIFGSLEHDVEAEINDSLTEFEPIKVFRRVFDKIRYPWIPAYFYVVARELGPDSEG